MPISFYRMYLLVVHRMLFVYSCNGRRYQSQLTFDSQTSQNWWRSISNVEESAPFHSITYGRKTVECITIHQSCFEKPTIFLMCFQNGSEFFRSFSADVFSCNYLEYRCDLPCFAHIANGNSSVFRTNQYVSKFPFYQTSTCTFVCFYSQSQPTANVAILFSTVFNACNAFGVAFSFCELGQRISNAFDEIDDVIAQLKWYLCPDELKRILPIIIINSQDPVALEYFGSTSCSRETFKKVCLNIWKNSDSVSFMLVL